MTFEQNSALPRRFVTALLPWLIGLAALIVYLATMNTTATLGSVGVVAKVSGWVWRPDLQQPLLFLALAPFRLLPGHLIPLALNIFNAVLAGLVITLLARTVAILPHDRTSLQRELERSHAHVLSIGSAWLPPLFAALVLGLQITFWENATAVTGEMIDVFVVAYVIRCLLEYRIDQRSSWMLRAAFLYAAGMTNNWALIALLPVFLTAIIWLRGLSFFNLGFLARMTFFSLLGLLLYLLLPLLLSHSSDTPGTFKSALTYNLGSQWGILKQLYYFYRENYRGLVVAATSLLPLFVISLRWRSSFGDDSPLGVFIAQAVFHFVHALFLGVCLFVTLSPAFSPRQLVPGMPFLTHAYLGAIVIGYCAGYFLLICAPPPPTRRPTRKSPLLNVARRTGWAMVMILFLLTPVVLVSRNLGNIELTNHSLEKDLAAQIERNLPANATILSDDPAQLALLRLDLQRRSDTNRFIFFDTQSAIWSDYHAFQKRRQPDVWPDTFASITNHGEIRPVGLIMLLSQLSTNHPLVYLQPSFGYYFERFEQTPDGLVYPLTAYPTNQLLASPLSAETTAANQKFWADFDENIMPKLKLALPVEEQADEMPNWKATLMARLHLSKERNLAAESMAQSYSRKSVYWAVKLQKSGQWDEAAKAFERALILNPDNVSAQVDLAYNKAHRTGETAPPEVAAAVEDRFGKYNDWNQVIGVCGPFDEPRFTFEQGRTYLRSSPPLYRQALQALHRVVELQPTNFVAKIWCADLYTMLNQPAEAMEIVQVIRQNPKTYGINATNQLDLDRVMATAQFRSGDKDAAQATLTAALARPEANAAFRTAAAQLYLQNKLYAAAVPVLDELVASNAADVVSLANRGYACVQLAKFDEAKESLTRALELDPKNGVVRLNRAIARQRSKDYAGAKEDYQTLLETYTNAFQVQFGLGEIAVAETNLPAARQYFEASLKLAPPGTPDYLQVSNRLAEISAGK